jgi:hypothetical protein
VVKWLVEVDTSVRTALAGTDCKLLVPPEPNRPLPPFPQHLTSPVDNTAQVWASPHETEDTPEEMMEPDGTLFVLLVPPFPSCPLLLRPQHFSAPSEVIKHE